MIKLKFCIIQMSFWCSVCAVPTFLSAYLYASGYTYFQVGAAFAVQTFGGFIGQFLWSYISDKYNTNKKPLITGNILMLLIFYCIFITKSIVVLTFLMGLCGLVQMAMPVLLDTWILKHFKDNPQEYGPIRSSASFAFALFALFYGTLISKYGFYIMPIFATIFVTITVVTSFFTEDASINNKINEETNKLSLKQGAKNLSSNNNYKFILIIGFLIGLTSGPFMQILSIKIKEINGTIGNQGIAIFAGTITQIPFLLLYKKISRFKTLNLLLFSIILTLLSYIIYGFATSLNLTILSMAINGAGFGIMLPSLRNYIFEITPIKLANTAQGLCDSIQNSLAGVIGNTVTGGIIGASNLKTAMLFYSISMVICIILLAKYIVNGKQKN